MPLDLNEVATRNAPRRRRDAQEAVASDASGRLARFQAFVETSAFGTNVHAEKVVSFDAAGEVLDARRIDPGARRGEWWPRREAFEDLWEHGRRFVYGALNAGGMGVDSDFGPICLVVEDPESPMPEALAVFPEDSAQRYTDATGGVDRDRAEAEATAWADRGALALSERRAEIGSESEWATLVCTPDRYFEVTRAGTLPLAAIGEVRLRRAYREELAELRSRALVRDPLTERQRRQADAYAALHRWRATNGTRLTSVS